MGAKEKTDSLIRQNLALDLLVENEHNPNKMTNREFDLLVANMQDTGITDPILVKPIEDGKYRIIGGHHRAKAARYLEFSEVPCTIVTDPDFDEEMETFQLVRHNMIRGHLDPNAFITLYGKYASKYGDDMLQDMFGFADEREFRALIKATEKSLPKEMKERFKAAAKEIKTVDELAKILNELFTNHGDTLPHGYMIVDFGGKQSIWVRVNGRTFNAVKDVGQRCISAKVCLDHFLGAAMQLIATGKAEEFFDRALELCPEVATPKGMAEAKETPTLDAIEAYEAL